MAMLESGKEASHLRHHDIYIFFFLFIFRIYLGELGELGVLWERRRRSLFRGSCIPDFCIRGAADEFF